MEETRRNLLVGSFVLCGLAALGTLIVLFGSGPTAVLGGEEYPLNIRFPRAGGIRAGNAVTVGGIVIGRVRSVGFFDPDRFSTGVRVTILVDAQYAIPADSVAETTEPGFGRGRPPIEITPGISSVMVSPDQFINGTIRGAVDAFVPEQIRLTFEKAATQVGEAAAALTPVLDDLHQILVQRSPADVDRTMTLQGNLASAMARFDETLRHFNEVLGDPQTKSRLKQAIENFHAISVDGKAAAADLKAFSKEMDALVNEGRTLMADTRGSVTRLEGEITVVARKAQSALEDGSELLDELHEAASVITRGEGTIGRLMRDPKLYEALVISAERLSQTVEEARLLIKQWQKGTVRVAF